MRDTAMDDAMPDRVKARSAEVFVDEFQ